MVTQTPSPTASIFTSSLNRSVGQISGVQTPSYTPSGGSPTMINQRGAPQSSVGAGILTSLGSPAAVPAPTTSGGSVPTLNEALIGFGLAALLGVMASPRRHTRRRR